MTKSPAATPEGLLLVDKPGGLTSHDVVSRVRGLAGTRRVGHAGTLDPMATGLLVLGIGRATRLLTHLVGADKTYTATIRLGQASSTDDAEGDVLAAAGAALTRDDVEGELPALTGAIEQVPSRVSAIKIDGKRAYERARAGETVQIPARPVTVHEFTITDLRRAIATGGVQVTDVDVHVRCSSGTYIRALARDLGDRLGVGGHLTALRRSHVGPFDVAHAMELPGRSDERPELREPAFLTLAHALAAAFPIRLATAAEARALSYGQSIPASIASGPTGVLGPEGDAIAVVENREGEAKPVLVLAPA